MAWFGGRGAEMGADIQDRYQELVDQDQYNSQHGLRPERLEGIDDAISDIIETMRGCEATDQIVDNMDADARLMMEVLQERQGLRNILYHINQNNAFRLLLRTQVGQQLFNNLAPGWQNRVEHVAVGAAAVGKATAIGVGTRALLGTVFGAGTVPLSFVAGGVTGFINGFRRGKERHESASAWMAELGILSRRDGQTRNQRVLNIETMSDSDLMRALGIMNNAVREKRVRGDSQQKMEFAAVYRLINNALQERREAEVETYNPENLSPIIDELDKKIGMADQEGKLISDFAAEHYKVEYGKIMGLKRQKERMTVLKSTIGGVAIGGTLGLVNEYGMRGAYEAVRDFFHIDGDTIASAKHEGLTNLLEAKREAIIHGGQLNGEMAHHAEVLDTLDKVTNNQISIDDLTPQQLESVNHLLAMTDHLSAGQHISLDGLHPGEMANLTEMLNRDPSSMHSLYEFAANHNIDMSQVLDNGQQFGQFLSDHREAFSAMPEQIQNFIISHPSVAEQFFGLGDESYKAALTLLGPKIAGIVGVAAAGGMFAGASIRQGRLRRDIHEAFQEGASTGRAAEAGVRRDYERSTRTESLDEVRGSQWVRFLNPPGHNEQYHVVRIGRNGELNIENYAHPGMVVPPDLIGLNIMNYLNQDGTINRHDIQVSNHPEAADAEAEIDLAPYEALHGIANLIGMVNVHGGETRVTFTHPPAAVALGQVLINISNTAHNPPTNCNLRFDFIHARVHGGEPQIELQPFCQFNGHDYRLLSNNVIDEDRIAAGVALRTYADTHMSDRVLLYLPGTGTFMRINSYDEASDSFNLSAVVNMVTGATAPPNNIARAGLETQPTCIFYNDL